MILFTIQYKIIKFFLKQADGSLCETSCLSDFVAFLLNCEKSIIHVSQFCHEDQDTKFHKGYSTTLANDFQKFSHSTTPLLVFREDGA